LSARQPGLYARLSQLLQAGVRSLKPQPQALVK